MIYYFNYHCEATGVLAVSEENDAADFDEPPLRGVDIDFCHRTVKAIDMDVRQERRVYGEADRCIPLKMESSLPADVAAACKHQIGGKGFG